MKRLLGIALALMLALSLAACGGGGSQQPSGNSNPPAGADTSDASDSTDGDEAAQDNEGERIRLEISNEDTEKGYLSAVCPAGWYNHSDEEYLFFSESETAGDYSKPYIRIGYAPTATSTGGSGEDITFELGGRNWEGLYNGDYNTYNVIHQLDGGGGLSVVSLGGGPDDAVYKMVVGSIWVEF